MIQKNSFALIKREGFLGKKPRAGIPILPSVKNSRLKYLRGAERFLPLFGDVVPQDMQAYRWENEECMKEVLYYLNGIMLARRTGIKKQEELYKKEILLIYENDKSIKGVNLLRKRGYPAKPFCFSPYIKKEPHIVRSKKHDWVLIDIEKSKKVIPPIALRELQILKEHRLIPCDIRVAYELKPEKTSTQIIKNIAKDQADKGFLILEGIGSIFALPFELIGGTSYGACPTLCISFGSNFYIELMRWKD